jgi:hypothetical protein
LPEARPILDEGIAILTGAPEFGAEAANFGVKSIVGHG